MQQPCDVVAQGCLSHGNCFVDFLSPTHLIPSTSGTWGSLFHSTRDDPHQAVRRGIGTWGSLFHPVDRMSPIASPINALPSGSDACVLPFGLVDPR